MFRPTGTTPYDAALSESRQGDAVRRANGVANLGVYGGKEAIPLIRGHVQDPAESVKVAAHYALALLGQPDVIPGLIAALAHEKHEDRKRASVALATVSGAGITCDHESVENCTAAKKEYEAWWKKSGAGLVWDPKKRTFGTGEGKAEKKAKK